MKTFYTILSVVIRPEIDEKLSIGLIMINDSQVSFLVSENKLQIVKKLVSTNFFNGVKTSLKLIENSIANNKRKRNNIQRVLELDIDDKSDVFNISYFNYLSNYNNNVISFSKPTFISLDYSKKLFLKLFEKLISEYDFIVQKKKPENEIEKFKKTFYPKVSEYFSISKEISSLQYKDLLMPIKVDLMGKNEVEVFANTIDMSKNLRSVELGIANLIHINRALPNAKQFIISSEPSKSNDVLHRVWNNFREAKGFEYVDYLESERISDYAKKHGVVPLI